MNKYLYSFEAIDYQGKSILAKELVDACNDLMELKEVTTKDLDKAGLAKIVKRNTGLACKFNVVEGSIVYVRPPFMDKNSPMIQHARRDYLFPVESDRLLEKKNKFEGLVDLKNSKIKGDFAESFTEFMIGSDNFGKNAMVNGSELAAVLLHEIGHVFVMFEMMGRFTRTNYFLEAGTRKLLTSDTKQQRILVLKELEDNMGGKFDNIERLAEVKKNKEFYRVLILNNAVNDSYNQLGFNIYDTRGYEQLADQFASRHGMASELASALDKYMKNHPTGMHRSYWWKGFHYILWVLEALQFIFGTVFSLGLALLIYYNVNYQLYDDPVRRFEKMKLDTISALKDDSLTDKERGKLLDTVDYIDSLIDNIDINQSFIEFYWNNISPWGRQEKKTIVFNEEMERWLNNRLFATAQLVKHKLRKS